ncbi:MAG: hypothetical protein GXO47_14215 [Chlorobi bacterium]|nr:hypothetical protein [Chlorobiota bacterium]
MLEKLKFTGLLVLFAFFAISANAQCFSFAKGVCKSKLSGYVHDGNYNATILSEGETAEIYKTFFKGQSYRVAVCKVDSLPDVYFKIIDGENNILFDSKTQETNIWDFDMKTTQQLIVQVKVSEKVPDSKVKTSGCVSVIFGIKKD